MMGRILIFTGIFLIIAGMLLLIFERLPGPGHLPGDIFIQKGNWRIYIPITTSIVLSIVLTLLFNILLRR